MSKSKFHISISLLLFSLVVLFLYLNESIYLNLSYRLSSFITLVCCGSAIIAVYKINNLHLLSFPIVFLGATFIFTCSSLFLYLLEPDIAFFGWKFIDVRSAQITHLLIILAFISFAFGSLFYKRRSFGNTFKTKVIEIKLLKFLAIALYFFSMVIVLYETIQGSGLALSFSGGYSAFANARKEGQMSVFLVASLSYFLPWSLIILASLANSQKKFYQVLAFALPAIIVMFLSGDRTAPLSVLILIFTAAYLKKIKKIKIDWKRTTVLVLTSIFLIVFVRNIRTVPIEDWNPQNLYLSAINQLGDTPAYSYGPLLATSTSLQTFVGTLKVVPERESFRYGLDYAKSVLVSIPFNNRLFDVDYRARAPGINTQPTQWISYHFNRGSKTGLGFLQIAEAYLQFGVAGIIILYMVLGYSLSTWWKSFSTKRNISPQDLSFILVVVMAILIWIRNDSYEVLRFTFWGWGLIFFIPKMIKQFTPIKLKS